MQFVIVVLFLILIFFQVARRQWTLSHRVQPLGGETNRPGFWTFGKMKNWNILAELANLHKHIVQSMFKDMPVTKDKMCDF